ncbi:MAG: hypothetical protein IJZ63_00225, partial [Clostridia bacterium]|nr:hypothetical protein [Clostridia bacterium]
YYPDVEEDILKHDILEFLLQLSSYNYVLVDMLPSSSILEQFPTEFSHSETTINSVFENYGLQLPRLSSVHQL